MGKRAGKAVRLAVSFIVLLNLALGPVAPGSGVYAMAEDSVSNGDMTLVQPGEDSVTGGDLTLVQPGEDSVTGGDLTQVQPGGDSVSNGDLKTSKQEEEVPVYEEEAENAVLAGGARIKECEEASGGALVHYLGSDAGNHEDGTASFTVTDVEAGNYELRFYYASSSNDRYFDIYVNDRQVSGGRQLVSTGSFEIPGKTPVIVDVELTEGENIIRFGCAGWYAPNLDRIQIFPAHGQEPDAKGYYEAESGQLGGQAVISDCQDASGGRMVGYLGGGDGEDRGYVVLNSIEVMEDGMYDVSVFYATKDSRSFTISVNGAEEVRLVCPSSGGFDKVGKAVVRLNMKAGENTVKFGCSDGYAPNLDRIYVPEERAETDAAADPRLTLQAEEAELFDGAVGDYNSSACAGGGKVSNIGGDNKGYVVFDNIKIEQASTYAIDVSYATKEDRKFLITIDGEQEIWMDCRAGFEWDVPNRHIVTCDLTEGTHCLTFSNPQGYAPNLDEIRLYPCEVFETQDYTFWFDLQTGRYNVAALGRTKICDAYAAVSAGGELLESIKYSHPVFTKESITDEFGTGMLFKAVFSQEGKPLLEQRFYLYEGQRYFLVQTQLAGEDGGQVSSNYMAPLYAKGLGSAENELDGNDYFLRVPYDNDGWVKYELNSINGSDTGYEAGAVLSEKSNRALVLGSLSHDTWKTGITYSGVQNQLYELALYGGTNGALTRDQSPHGMVSGEKVESPLMFVGVYDDWRDGMNDYAAANTKVTARKESAGGVPFGWNSWGSVQTGLNLETARGISDYIKDNFQDIWQPQEDDVVYTVLDSYWDNLTDEELRTFVEHCRANGQEPGIYWAPFVSWYGEKDLATHFVEGSEGVTYDEIILRKADGTRYGNDLDGAFPVDITHPAAQKRVDYFIDRFKKAGFTYIKLDFLVHGALEGLRYDQSVQTGTQAYNLGMKYVTDRLEGQMFVNLSIAPTFPYQYADGKRIACDAYYSIGNTEYTLNGLTYGFWQKQLYQYPDPDHLVVWGKDAKASLEEARSRVTSGILLGTSFLTGDNFINPAGDQEAAEARFREVLTNEDILSVARSGKIFRPLTVDHRKTAANIFTMTDGEVSYVAVLNYGPQTMEKEIDLAALFGAEATTPVKELWAGSDETIDDGILHVTLAGKDSKVYRIGTPGEPDNPGGGDNPGGEDNPGGGDNPGGEDNPGGGDNPGGEDNPGGDNNGAGDGSGSDIPSPDQGLVKSPATGDWDPGFVLTAGLGAAAAAIYSTRRYRRAKHN